MKSHFLAVFAGLLVCLPASQGQGPKPAILVMKDGFVIKGVVKQARDIIFDKEQGVSFSIPSPGSPMLVDDGVRRIFFVPRQIPKEGVIDNSEDKRNPITFRKQGGFATANTFLPDWRIQEISEFDKKWERAVHIGSSRGPIDLKQRLTVLSPRYTLVESLSIEWLPRYFTKELDPQVVHNLLKDYFQTKTDVGEIDKQRQMFQFLFQVGWYEYTEQQLQRFVEKFPEQKSKFADLESDLKRVQALTAFEDLEQSYKAGQHKETRRRIEYVHKSGMAKLLNAELFKMQEIKNEYAGLQEKLDQAAADLKSLPMFANALHRQLFTEAAAEIAGELHFEGLPRLELFSTYAQQFASEVKANRTPTQSADKVLALAISGWLQGKDSASPDVAMAASLWQARKMVMSCLTNADPANRANIANIFAAQQKLPVDVVGRMLPLLPPADPYKVDAVGLPFELTPEVGKESCTVILPPEYSHHRAYPVLIVLHSQGESAADTMARFRDLAGRHGYILLGPSVGRGHEGVVGCLRDLRRRFNVDSDRVFLFGYEDGATAAFDIGLSHPHEFAGVLPMCGDPSGLPASYWPNGQYLPFYVVDGGFSEKTCKAHNELFKKWIRYGYPSLYFEYKGRMRDWFAAELPSMFDWMNRKKRAYPVSQLGTYNTGGGPGEEFCTGRIGDDRFYWLGTTNISPARMFSGGSRLPATLQARISTGNELVKRADGSEAKIWNQVAIRTSGIGNVVVWFGPNMIDFNNPVVFRVNSQPLGRAQDVKPSMETMLEEVYRTGDRQRLYYARIELGPQ